MSESRGTLEALPKVVILVGILVSITFVGFVFALSVFILFFLSFFTLFFVPVILYYRWWNERARERERRLSQPEGQPART